MNKSTNISTNRLSNDKYIRPKQTKTEQLTDEDIKKLIEDYKEMDIYQIPLGSHVRYFIKTPQGNKFRKGGFLHKNNGLPKYVVLRSSNNKTWTVQINNAVFFIKMSLNEIKTEYKNHIDLLDKKIADLHNHIINQKKELDQLRKDNNYYRNELDKFRSSRRFN